MLTGQTPGIKNVKSKFKMQNNNLVIIHAQCTFFEDKIYSLFYMTKYEKL